MRTFVLLFLSIACYAQTRVDNVLAGMIPPGTVSLLGARMDELKTTALYRKIVQQRKLADLDRFAGETGFDPRRDVKELLLASNGEQNGTVLLARGAFHVSGFGSTKEFKHGEYVIHGDERAGFCILDSTLAAAGPLPPLYAALDQWHAHAPQAAPGLLKRAEEMPASEQIWAVSDGGLTFVAGMLRAGQSGPDFAQILRSLQSTSFRANLTGGLDALAQGNTKDPDDAKSLADAARGLIGFGRLSVPENHRELLKLWDGFHVDQTGAHITITVKIPQDLIDQLMDMLQTSGGPGRVAELR